MLHPLVLADLLADEADVASERLGSRVAGLRHDGRHVRCPLRQDGHAPRSPVLDGGWYGAEPFRVACTARMGCRCLRTAGRGGQSARWALAAFKTDPIALSRLRSALDGRLLAR